ncbi:MAG: HEAT repeat domain-containing protein, partial [Planctomycetaceae bacterium]
AAIVIGNARERTSVPVLVKALDDSESLVRGAVAWALGRIGGDLALQALQSQLAIEENPEVANEIRSAIAELNVTV